MGLRGSAWDTLMQNFGKPSLVANPNYSLTAPMLSPLAPPNPALPQQKLDLSMKEGVEGSTGNSTAQSMKSFERGDPILSRDQADELARRLGITPAQGFQEQYGGLRDLAAQMNALRAMPPRQDVSGTLSAIAGFTGNPLLAKTYQHPQTPEEMQESQLKLADLIQRERERMSLTQARATQAQKIPESLLGELSDLQKAQEGAKTTINVGTQAESKTNPPPKPVKSGGGAKPLSEGEADKVAQLQEAISRAKNMQFGHDAIGSKFFGGLSNAAASLFGGNSQQQQDQFNADVEKTGVAPAGIKFDPTDSEATRAQKRDQFVSYMQDALNQKTKNLRQLSQRNVPILGQSTLSQQPHDIENDPEVLAAKAKLAKIRGGK